MAITDELRKYAHDCCARIDDDIHAIADRIDAEHAEAQRRWMAELDAARERSFNADFDDGFASADDWLAQHEDAMREHGWVKLPKDADGEPIHVGDVMKSKKIGGGFGEPFEVVGYIMSNGELEPMDEHKCPRKHKYLHHHKQPTVEDVLRDMHAKLDEVTALYVGEVIDSDERDRDEARIFAEYAAKLRLAGEGE